LIPEHRSPSITSDNHIRKRADHPRVRADTLAVTVGESSGTAIQRVAATSQQTLTNPPRGRRGQ
jgi:hypothetical protein